MKLHHHNFQVDERAERGSVLIIVMWICHRAGGHRAIFRQFDVL